MKSYLKITIASAMPHGPDAMLVRENGEEKVLDKKVFHMNYASTDKMAFGMAFEAMRQGKQIHRLDMPVNTYMWMQAGTIKVMKMIEGRLTMIDWAPTLAEIVADDWYVIKGPT